MLQITLALLFLATENGALCQTQKRQEIQPRSRGEMGTTGSPLVPNHSPESSHNMNQAWSMNSRRALWQVHSRQTHSLGNVYLKKPSLLWAQQPAELPSCALCLNAEYGIPVVWFGQIHQRLVFYWLYIFLLTFFLYVNKYLKMYLH